MDLEVKLLLRLMILHSMEGEEAYLQHMCIVMGCSQSHNKNSYERWIKTPKIFASWYIRQE